KKRTHANRDHESDRRVRDHDRPLARAQMQHVAERVARQQRIANAPGDAERAPPRRRRWVVPQHVAHVADATSSWAMRSPVSVRYGSTTSNLQNGSNTGARPPVATTNGTTSRGHSPLILLTNPSIASALPNTTPERMHSSVRRPITRAGGEISVAGSLAVRRNNVSADVRTPGAITPPRNTPSAVMQSYVVAVPRSTTIVSRR